MSLKSLNEVLLDLRGHYKLVAAVDNNETVKEFDWKNAVLDALIFSLIGALTTYASSLTIGTESFAAVHTSVVAFVLQFVTYLGIKRGIVKKEE